MNGPRFSVIPAGAVVDRSLEPRDLQMLALLGCYTDKQGWCRRSQVKMAVQLGCGRSSIQRSLDRLVEAGWVQKKRPDWSNAEGPPSNSYEYRVILDRDDAPSVVLDDDEIDDSDSHASDANQAADCPPVGRGAQPSTGTGAQPYVGTKNVPLERSADAADTRATPLISPVAMDLAEKLLVIAGHDKAFWPPGWCGAPMRVQTWLNTGWPPEIILAATQAVVNRKTGPPAASVQFFEKAIAEEIARQNRPVPEASNVQEPGNHRPKPKGNAFARLAARLGQSAGGPIDSS